MKRDLKDFGYIVFFGLLGLLVIGALWFGITVLRNETADFRGNSSVINKTRANGNYRIAQYDHFFDLCASVQDQEVTIKAQERELASPDGTANRRSQIRQNLSALEANRGEQINHYNADARKSYTAGQFRSSDLPYQIDPTQEPTTCTA